ncbi:MAG: hypothetical protein GEV04_07535 [Actinophytocola sp.]|nr:hypothetical protein [Actinophytocola sp.]
MSDDHRYDSFVAIGDSFTEGVSDTHPDGGYRGWADVLAARLAETRPGLRYANLASAHVFDDPRLWADDRIHLNGDGHRRIAEAVDEAIGLAPHFDWQAPLPPMGHATWADQRLADARWARNHLLPWVGRRLAGRSSGDGLAPKRPSLTPLHSDSEDIKGTR